MSFVKYLKVRKRKTKTGECVFLQIQDCKDKEIEKAGFTFGTDMEVTVDKGVITAKICENSDLEPGAEDFISLPTRQQSSSPVFSCVTPAGVGFIPEVFRKKIEEQIGLFEKEDKHRFKKYCIKFNSLQNSPSENKEALKHLSKKIFMVSRKFLDVYFKSEAEKLCIDISKLVKTKSGGHRNAKRKTS